MNVVKDKDESVIKLKDEYIIRDEAERVRKVKDEYC